MNREEAKSKIRELEAEIDAALNLDYPIGSQIRFTWLRNQKILAEIIDIARGGALRVILLESATTGTQKIGQRMVIPAVWIVEKIA